jgi:hypothetical protein
MVKRPTENFGGDLLDFGLSALLDKACGETFETTNVTCRFHVTQYSLI